jgi:hypothetical protein
VIVFAGGETAAGKVALLVENERLPQRPGLAEKFITSLTARYMRRETAEASRHPTDKLGAFSYFSKGEAVGSGVRPF